MKKILRHSLTILLIFCIGYIYVNAKDSEKTPILHFVQISDIHTNFPTAVNNNRLNGHSQELLNTAINQINKIEELDFVLSSGDFIDVSDKKLAETYIELGKKSKYPIYSLFGNHETYGTKGEFLDKKKLAAFIGNSDSRSFPNGMFYYSFPAGKDFEIVCLDLSIPENTSNGEIKDDQLNWLEETIKTKKDKYIIVFSHFPIIEPYKSETHFIRNPGRDKLLALLEKYSNVVGYYSGHYHAARLKLINNIIHNSNPALIEFPNAFREIIVTKDLKGNLNFEFKFHQVNNKELIEKSKKASTGWQLKYGQEKDRNNILTIGKSNPIK